MEIYHYAWLSAHPNKTEEWLASKLIDGFDIHHLDWNKENNNPDNLVLMDHVDHMMIHGSGRKMDRTRKGKSVIRKSTIERNKKRAEKINDKINKKVDLLVRKIMKERQKENIVSKEQQKSPIKEQQKAPIIKIVRETIKQIDKPVKPIVVPIDVGIEKQIIIQKRYPSVSEYLAARNINNV